MVGVALRVRDGRLEALLERVRLEPGETLEGALARALDVEALAHYEQLETRFLADGTLATAYLGLVPADGEHPGSWRPVASRGLSGDDAGLVAAAQARLRGKLSYTNVGFALAPRRFTISELRELYVAVLGHEISPTNLQRVLLRRGEIERVGELRAPGRTGGRPASLFRFRVRRLEVTDEFAVLGPRSPQRPRGSRASD